MKINTEKLTTTKCVDIPNGKFGYVENKGWFNKLVAYQSSNGKFLWVHKDYVK